MQILFRKKTANTYVTGSGMSTYSNEEFKNLLTIHLMLGAEFHFKSIHLEYKKPFFKVIRYNSETDIFYVINAEWPVRVLIPVTAKDIMRVKEFVMDMDMTKIKNQ
jgi:hypothetical protein